ncbi:hypothetical protein Tco_1447261 [Tanacetum coccineum]
MLKKFSLEDSKPIKTPMSSETKLTRDEDEESVDDTKYRGMIGSLLYLTASQPDIMFSVCLCTHFQEDPKTSHLEAVKRIFRYIKGTTHLGLWYPKGMGVETIINADSDHAGDYVDCKSTGGAIDLSKNPVLHSRTKHIEIRHHFRRDNVQKGNISIDKVSSEDNIADILTKHLKKEPFNLLILGLGYDTRDLSSSLYRHHCVVMISILVTPRAFALAGCDIGLMEPNAYLTTKFSKKQTALAISTIKVEYISAEKACQQALWMKQALIDYDIKLNDMPALYDNKSAIDLSKNPVLHSCAKLIEIQHHVLRDNVQKGNIFIEKVSSEDNIADILTKPLKREPFNLLRLGIGLMEPNA